MVRGEVNAVGEDCKNLNGICSQTVSRVSWSSYSAVKKSNLEIVRGISEGGVH